MQFCAIMKGLQQMLLYDSCEVEQAAFTGPYSQGGSGGMLLQQNLKFRSLVMYLRDTN